MYWDTPGQCNVSLTTIVWSYRKKNREPSTCLMISLQTTVQADLEWNTGSCVVASHLPTGDSEFVNYSRSVVYSRYRQMVPMIFFAYSSTHWNLYTVHRMHNNKFFSLVCELKRYTTIINTINKQTYQPRSITRRNLCLNYRTKITLLFTTFSFSFLLTAQKTVEM